MDNSEEKDQGGKTWICFLKVLSVVISIGLFVGVCIFLGAQCLWLLLYLIGFIVICPLFLLLRNLFAPLFSNWNDFLASLVIQLIKKYRKPEGKEEWKKEDEDEDSLKIFIKKWLWESFARLGRVFNLLFAYVINKHLSILFGAMLAVVGVSVCLLGVIDGKQSADSNKGLSLERSFKNECSCSKGRAVLAFKSNDKVLMETQGKYFCVFCFCSYMSSMPNIKKEENQNDEKKIYRRRFQWVLDKMFSYDKMREEIVSKENDNELSLKKGKAALAFILFLFTWFVGGGVLVSALIATTIDIWSGKWRVWGIFLRNHVVVLGWDDTVPSLLKEHIESHKRSFFKSSFLKRSFYRPETIVVMTEHPAHKVRLALRDVLNLTKRKGVWLWPFINISKVVCNGKFDDADEIRKLCLQRANSIYVMGEMNDVGHDIRVLMAPKKIGNYSNSFLQDEDFQYDTRRLNCHLNIKSLHLFWQHIRGETKLGKDQKICLRPLNIVSHNFYDSWVKRLFSRVPIDKEGKDKDKKSGNLHFAFQENDDGDIHLVIVGFGSFGQALAVEAATVAHYGNERRTYITVIDDDIGEKERDFRVLFPRIDEITDVYLSFITDVKIGSEKFRRLLEEFARNGKKEGEVKGKNQQLTVALTLEDDEACLKQVLPVYRSIDGDSENTQLIVSQQTCETDLDQKEETFNGMYGCKNVKFFGFSNGTGFDVWRREKLARGIARERYRNKKKWWDLKEREKQYFRMIIDGLEEFCYVENFRLSLEICSITRSTLSEIIKTSEELGINNEAFKKIDSAVRKILDIDEELIKEDEISSKLFLGIRKSEFIKIKKEECT